MQLGTVLALTASLALGGFHLAHTYLEVRPFQRAMERAHLLSSESRMHDVVLFEGTVEPAVDSAVPGRLAMGFEQRIRRGKRVGWEITAVYRPRFSVMVRSMGAASVIWSNLGGVPFDFFPGRPRRRPLRPDVEAIGLDGGDTISCLATVLEVRSPVLSATEWGCFAGTLNELRRLPALLTHRGRVAAAISTGMCFAVIGVMLIGTWVHRRLSS